MTGHMTFKEFRNETIAQDNRDRFLQRCGEREWLLPDGQGLFDIHVRPHGVEHTQVRPEDAISINIGFSKARPCDGKTTLRDGRVVEGLYFDYLSNGMGSLTVKQMELALAARKIIDQWIAGEIDSLPVQPFI